MTSTRNHKRDASSKLFARAVEIIPGGVNSPVRAFRGVGGTPRFIEMGQGSRIFDADNLQYIDCVGSWGPMILGHGHRYGVEAVQKTATKRFSFGAPTFGEVELAEMVIAALPSIEMLRLVNSGTEATMSALRLARAATGRKKVIKFDGGYHGHVAAIIVEPVAGNMGCVPPRDGFLKGLRQICDDNGSLLIFDEVMTGFR